MTRQGEVSIAVQVVSKGASRPDALLAIGRGEFAGGYGLRVTSTVDILRSPVPLFMKVTDERYRQVKRDRWIVLLMIVAIIIGLAFFVAREIGTASARTIFMMAERSLDAAYQELREHSDEQVFPAPEQAKAILSDTMESSFWEGSQFHYRKDAVTVGANKPLMVITRGETLWLMRADGGLIRKQKEFSRSKYYTDLSARPKALP